MGLAVSPLPRAQMIYRHMFGSGAENGSYKAWEGTWNGVRERKCRLPCQGMNFRNGCPECP